MCGSRNTLYVGCVMSSGRTRDQTRRANSRALLALWVIHVIFERKYPLAMRRGPLIDTLNCGEARCAAW